jgi:hypothetical protein
MSDFSTSLDKYLATEPEDPFEVWSSEVVEFLPQSFFDENETWIMNDETKYNEWLRVLFYEDKYPSEAALIIQRTFNIYLKQKDHVRNRKIQQQGEHSPKKTVLLENKAHKRKHSRRLR